MSRDPSPSFLLAFVSRGIRGYSPVTGAQSMGQSNHRSVARGYCDAHLRIPLLHMWASV